jgi:glycosyltransferase involved in cell wall biosynthesis
MSKKRILIVVNYFYPYVSGVSEYARETAATLSGHYEVTVLTGKHLPGLPDQEFFEGYNLIRAQPLLFLDKGYISFDFVRIFKRLSCHSDVINLHLPMLESGLLSLLTRHPLLVTYQCDMAVVGGLLSRIAVLGVRLSMRLAVARSNAIVVLSMDYATSSPIVKRYLEKVSEIAPPNRFDDEIIGSSSQLKNQSMVCGFVGRFVLEKGIEVIIEAARILKGESIEFWLAGDYKNVAGGSVYEQIKDSIESLGGRVRLIGRLSNEELIDFYRSIDVLLLPSTNRFEAFGMVQMEAMTFGATVVTSDMPGVREVVHKTKIGQLCEPGSARSLVDAILRARAERKSVSREDVRAAVFREFSKEKFVGEYLAIVQKLSCTDAVY